MKMLTCLLSILLIFTIIIIIILGLHPWHMEVPGLGVKSELPLPVYTATTAMQDLSYICDLHPGLWQRQILNPLSKTWDGTCILTDTMSGS